MSISRFRSSCARYLRAASRRSRSLRSPSLLASASALRRSRVGFFPARSRRGAREGHQAVAQEIVVPRGAILRGEEDGHAFGVDACLGPRRAERHQREQAERLGLAWHEIAQEATEAEALGLQVEAHELAGGGG